MNPFSLEKHTLKNGLTVLYCRTPQSSAFELSITIDTGVRDEHQKNNGVSHFLEHMLFRGSRSHPSSIELAKSLESLGGETNAMTGVEHTSYWVKGDGEKIKEAISRFADFFLYPTYADLEIERKIILQEFFSDYNDEGNLIDTESLGLESLFSPHPLGLPVIGLESSIKNISLKDLQEKRELFYLPSNCVLSIASAMPLENFIDEIETYFVSHWPCKTKTYKRDLLDFNSFCQLNSKKAVHSIILQNNSDNQYVLKLLLPTIGNLCEGAAEVTFLQRILDDGICTRLPSCIREKHGLVYDISCDSQFFFDVGVFSIDATVSEDKLDILLAQLGEELSHLLNSPPTKEEVDHIRYRYLFDLKQILETPSRLLQRETSAHLMGSQFAIQNEIQSVTQMTPEQIFKRTQSIFAVNKKGFVLVGPKARRKRNLVEDFLFKCQPKIKKDYL